MLIPLGSALAKYVVSLAGDAEDMIFTCGHDISLLAGGQAAADLAFTNLLTAIPAANWGTNFTLEGVELVVGGTSSGLGPYFTYFSSGAAVTGTSSGTRPPNNTAALVTKQTSVAGRRGRGRMFIPGFIPAVNVNEAGVIESAVRTVRQGLLDDWFEKCQVENLEMVILHSSAPATPAVLDGLRLESKMATQRRRMRP